MPVRRDWIPSPNHSSSRARSRLLVVHTSEGATTYTSLGNFLAQPSAGVSYHVGFDDRDAGTIGEYVKPPQKSWSAYSANNEGEHGCCCVPYGAAMGWTRDQWLAKPRMLDACAAWLSEEAARYDIPLVRIGADQIRAGAAGVCGHADCVAAGLGGTHTDPGPNFPWDVVLGKAPAPGPEVDEMWTSGTAVIAPGKTAQLSVPHGAKTCTLRVLVTRADETDGKPGTFVVANRVTYTAKTSPLWQGELWINAFQRVDREIAPADFVGVGIRNAGSCECSATLSGT